MNTFIQCADEQQPEGAVAVLGGISGPYTNLKKKRDEGKHYTVKSAYKELIGTNVFLITGVPFKRSVN